ncbi:unnamed protein product [Ambrosiozyma monospora]|uniref:Unnamed protein product n=1 Tax=Ambrosiozyma monospora TaxID=43982 RepID=A0ACB5T676_AMBMO|nr:unnamed protein product [Ambrosiozyma monospora]
MLQLSQGCGNFWCHNENCKSSGLIRDGKFANGFADISKYVRDGLLGGSSVGVNQLDKFWFCVDIIAHKKHMLMDFVACDPECEYALGWCSKSVYTVKFVDGDDLGNINRIRAWLDDNGVKNNE